MVFVVLRWVQEPVRPPQDVSPSLLRVSDQLLGEHAHPPRAPTDSNSFLPASEQLRRECRCGKGKRAAQGQLQAGESWATGVVLVFYCCMTDYHALSNWHLLFRVSETQVQMAKLILPQMPARPLSHQMLAWEKIRFQGPSELISWQLQGSWLLTSSRTAWDCLFREGPAPLSRVFPD